ncbi:hypothetical protein AAMO2058_000084400 [Amorphochlora amoebiformis]
MDAAVRLDSEYVHRRITPRGTIRRLYSPDSKFFEHCNRDRILLGKQWLLDLPSGCQSFAPADQEIVCREGGCRMVCRGIEAFEMHYETAHRHKCGVCKRSFPNERYLSLHVSERHDSFFQLQVEAGNKMFECLVESCKRRFGSRRARRAHLSAVHTFPQRFRFDEPPKLRRRRVGAKSESGMLGG